jgi:acylphosphatase
MSDTVRGHLLVTGRVQGVAFRQATVDEARRLALTGWVKNRPDGAVEAVAEGEQRQVEALVAWCHHGPRLARVEHVSITWEEPRGDLAGFDIMW